MARRNVLDPNTFARRLFELLPSRYDRLADVLSLGQNQRWRREMVDRALDGAPGCVLDVASGTAGVALQLEARSGCAVVASDLSPDMLRTALANVAAAGSRVALVQGRGEQLPFADATFDAVTFTYLLRYVADPAATLGELARVVRPGGVMASLEFHVPPRAFWRFWWWGYTRLVLPVFGLLLGGRAWFGVGRFLGPNISTHYRHYPLSWTIEAWRAAGFESVGTKVMSLGGGLVMWGVRSQVVDADVGATPLAGARHG